RRGRRLRRRGGEGEGDRAQQQAGLVHGGVGVGDEAPILRHRRPGTGLQAKLRVISFAIFSACDFASSRANHIAMSPAVKTKNAIKGASTCTCPNQASTVVTISAAAPPSTQAMSS